MPNWVIDSKSITYPDGELKRVVFRKSETGEIQINEMPDVAILNLSIDEAIRVLAEAKSRLIDPILRSDAYIDMNDEIIVEVYIEGWRTEFSEFEQQAFAADDE